MSGGSSDSELKFGAVPEAGGVRFSVWSGAAERIWVCLFDAPYDETARHELTRDDRGVFSAFVPGAGAGTRYGFRADGPCDPAKGFWFDPAKLLMDPYALAIDWPYQYNALMAAPRWQQCDTAAMMPKAVVTALPPPLPLSPPVWREGGLVYEVAVRAFSMRHLDVPAEQRGTIAALAHPAVIAHLKRIGVGAVELMPIAAWIDERHLRPLGLHNSWGYNPVSFMVLDPRLAPGGLDELRAMVAALHEAGIGVLLDVVFNHTGESDALGPTLSLRGLDARAYYRHAPDGTLVNDTGTGNMLACDHPMVRRLVLDAMRHFVAQAGIDGFRFDLAPVLGRRPDGFDPQAPLLQEMLADPVLGSRMLIAEPWDIGPGGYQLGSFPPPFREWNDRYRDDVRRFWRGDAGMIGALATRLSGSSDIFERSGEATRAVNFIAAHDGMTLRDLVSYEHKHNKANGEDNRDGHDENLSWNNGVEGPSADPAVAANRLRDVKALLSTLFASRGAIMLTAGDEFGRTQHGNNNAYALDDKTVWLDWEGSRGTLVEHVEAMARLRAEFDMLRGVDFLTPQTAAWLREDGQPMTVSDWEDAGRRAVALVLHGENALAILVNGTGREVRFALPDRAGGWQARIDARREEENRFAVAARAVGFVASAGKGVT
ncbi:MAG TPA: glycogen debranching protein GlgX [Rhizobiaceae bacterium]|nr:glycogen debranching protein GlgX [Rhizobiaceae bacterium]